VADTCASCRFWDRSKTSSEKVGDCRRRGPQINVELLRLHLPGRKVSWDSLDDHVYEASTFPVTHEESWCGEHEHPGSEAFPC
jgi:hypothetical protein